MKKLLAIAFLMCLTTTYVNATEAQTPVKEGKAQEVQAKQDAMRRHRERAFEQRLGLTEVQKLKAREIRMNGHENIRPVINSAYTTWMQSSRVFLLGRYPQKRVWMSVASTRSISSSHRHRSRCYPYLASPGRPRQ